MIENFTLTLSLIIAPWGIFSIAYLLSNLADNIHITTFEQKNQKKFEKAYLSEKVEQVFLAEESTMYDRLQELSRTHIRYEKKKTHIKNIATWTQEKKYPGNKKQYELLINALIINKKAYELVLSIAKQLVYVINTMTNNTDSSKNENILILNNNLSNDLRIRTSIIISIVLFYPYIFFSHALDNISIFYILYLFILLISSLLIVFKMKDSKSYKEKIFKISITILIALIYFYLFSYWNHILAKPIEYRIEKSNVIINTPKWLIYNNPDPISGLESDQPILIENALDFSHLSIIYDETFLELYYLDEDGNKNTIQSHSTISIPTNTLKIYLKPICISYMFTHQYTNLIFDYSLHLKNRNNMEIDIYIHNPLWLFYCKIFRILFGGSVISALITLMLLKDDKEK